MFITKNQRLTLGIARSHGSKVQKFNFWANFECISACQNLPMGFYCLSESPPYALLKTIRVPMDTVGIFCYKATNFQFLRKLVVLKNP